MTLKIILEPKQVYRPQKRVTLHLDERYRMTGQQSGTDVSPGSEPEAPGAAPKVVGSPNQGTDSR
jgi:hypothetical protein